MTRRITRSDKLPHDCCDLLPRLRLRIDQVEVIGSGDFQQVCVFISVSCLLRFGGNVVAAELSRNGIVGRTMNQPLASMENRQLQRIGFTVMVGDLRWSAPEKFHHSVIAQMELIGPLQVDKPAQRDHPAHAWLMRRQAERELASGGVSHNDDLAGIEMVCGRALQKEMIGRPDILERTRPGSAFIAYAAVFEIRRRVAIGSQRRTEVSGMLQAVSGPPKPSVDVDDQGRESRMLSFRRQPQVKKLVWIGSVRDSVVRWRRFPREDVFGHAGIILLGVECSNSPACVPSVTAHL
jgi:hypothetical protein